MTTSLVNGTVYYLIDDTQIQTSGVGGSGSGQPVSPEFSAPSVGAAQAVAQQFATLFQCAVRLVVKGSAPPWTPSFIGSATSLALSNAPSGIVFASP
jgi:hypothetical protein